MFHRYQSASRSIQSESHNSAASIASAIPFVAVLSSIQEWHHLCQIATNQLGGHVAGRLKLTSLRTPLRSPLTCFSSLPMIPLVSFLAKSPLRMTPQGGCEREIHTTGKSSGSNAFRDDGRECGSRSLCR